MTVLARRLFTVSSVFLLLVFTLGAAPLWIPVAMVVDWTGRGQRSALRCGAFLTWYLGCEAIGVLAAFAVIPWRLGGRGAFRRANSQLQNFWGRALFLGAGLCFGIRLETENAEVAATGPLLLLMRHATLVDTLIPTLAIAVPAGLDLRYVLKSELLWDPCLDIVGNRMGHWFARRGSSDGAREIAGVVAMAEGLGPGDGVMVYPEGTRFSEAKRDRILARLESEGDAERLEQARGLRNVLPLRLGGTLALLDAHRDLDIVFCTHTGLEAANRFRDLWRGGITDAVLRAHFWRVPRRDVPEGTREQAAWIAQQWKRVDDWIEANRGA